MGRAITLVLLLAGACANDNGPASEHPEAGMNAGPGSRASRDGSLAEATVPFPELDGSRTAASDSGEETSPGDDAGAPAPDAAVAPRICPDSPAVTDPLPPTGQRQASLVEGGFGFVEGPVWHADQGALFFSDMDFSTSSNPLGPAGRIHRYVPGSGTQVFLMDANCNGLALDLEGQLLACTHDSQTLSRFDPDTGMRDTIGMKYMGMAFNSPNDLTVRSDGTVYFTDPDWQLGPRTSETGVTGVYRRSPTGVIASVDATLDKPNGIALSPDEETLYVGSAGNDILTYAVMADGSTSGASSFASPGASDGLAVDCAGNLYVTSGDVVVYDPGGNELGRITLAESPANVAFGGSDRQTLFITARTGLYAIELLIPGYPY